MWGNPTVIMCPKIQLTVMNRVRCWSIMAKPSRWSNRSVLDRTSDGRIIQGPGAVAHLRIIPPPSTCWWCGERPAATGEHKFKRTDLARLMADDDALLWGDGSGSTREIRGKSGIERDRYGVVKFPKSLCAVCNNVRSQPFDDSYDVYSEFVRATRLRGMPGVSLERIYGEEWQERALNLARYYAKHFGCRMVRAGIRVPLSLRAFLDGEIDMPDAHMAFVTTDSVNAVYRGGLSISPDFVESDRGLTRFVRCVLVNYIGPIGVRYEWREEGFDEGVSQFFRYPHPLLNRFADEVAVCEGRTRHPGWRASLLPWVNRPRE